MIKIINKTIESADGHTIPYKQYEPTKQSPNAIVLVYEIFGLTSHINEVASEYAENGFLVNVPDIFSRLEKNIVLPYNKQGLKKGLSLKNQLEWDLPVMDIVALAASLKRNYNVSVLGYCYGASISWLAMQKAFIFDKGVCYYGSSIPDFLDKQLNCSAVIHLGKKDEGIPVQSVEKIKNYISKEKNEITLYEYDNADHGFNCKDRKSYNKDAAEIAFERSLNFLKGM